VSGGVKTFRRTRATYRFQAPTRDDERPTDRAGNYQRPPAASVRGRRTYAHPSGQLAAGPLKLISRAVKVSNTPSLSLSLYVSPVRPSVSATSGRARRSDRKLFVNLPRDPYGRRGPARLPGPARRPVEKTGDCRVKHQVTCTRRRPPWVHGRRGHSRTYCG